MKYIKTFDACTDEEKLIYDDCSDSWCWKVTTKYPDILIIFDKLGVDKDFGDWLWSEDNRLIKDFSLIKTKYETGSVGWSYAGVDFETPSYRKPSVYMGEVEITEEDREKWKMKEDVKKYNI